MTCSRKCDVKFEVTCRAMDDHLFELLQNNWCCPIFTRKSSQRVLKTDLNQYNIKANYWQCQKPLLTAQNDVPYLCLTSQRAGDGGQADVTHWALYQSDLGKRYTVWFQRNNNHRLFSFISSMTNSVLLVISMFGFPRAL